MISLSRIVQTRGRHKSMTVLCDRVVGISGRANARMMQYILGYLSQSCCSVLHNSCFNRILHFLQEVKPDCNVDQGEGGERRG